MQLRGQIVTLVAGLGMVAAVLPGSLPAVAKEAGPAAEVQVTGEPGPYRIRSNASARCLDSNSKGEVYTNVCGAGNRYQKWIIWNGGFTKNQATGRCLVTYGADVRTAPCDATKSFQYWRHWSGGYFQQARVNDHTLESDAINPGNVYSGLPCEFCQRQYWSVYIDSH